jgi:hypothetical protein
LISAPTSVRGKHRVLALLSEEPAGRISIRNAGAISFEAALSWRSGDEVPTGPILDVPVPGAKFFSTIETDDVPSATRHIFCEVRALYDEQLTDALDAALRSVTTQAAFTEAVLETRAVRLADPSVPPAALVEELARQLWEARLSVSFGPSWTPAPGADISVGVQGLEQAFEAFLRRRLAWRTLPLEGSFARLDQGGASG